MSHRLRRIVWIIVAVPLALIAVAAGTAVALPAARHIFAGLWNLPDRLPSSAESLTGWEIVLYSLKYGKAGCVGSSRRTCPR